MRAWPGLPLDSTVAVLIAAGALLAACGDDTTGGEGGSGGTPSGGAPAGGTGGMPTGGTGGMGGTGGAGGNTGGGGSGGGPCVNSLDPLAMGAAIPSIADTGLYADVATKTLESYVDVYEPKFKLWSDGTEKARFIYLPECDTIDTTDMDFWSFPVGTRVWKEFALGGARLETRFMTRVGPAPGDWIMATYLWSGAEDDATRVTDGQADVLGTGHDIPSEAQCVQCHGGMFAGGTPSRVLGFGAVQLSHSLPGITISDLISDSKLSDPPAGPITFNFTATEEAALGYLHANCGNCHNASNDGVSFVSMQTMLLATDVNAVDTAVYNTTVDQDTTVYGNLAKRVDPGSPITSAVYERASHRNGDMGFPPNVQMPPIGTEIVDPVGIVTLEDWICDLGGGCN